MPESVRARRQRLLGLCEALPEVDVSGDQHLALRVRGKTLGYYLHDHQGDGRSALCCKAAPGDLDFLTRHAPDRYYAPAYLGSRGWVALRLDTPTVDWSEVGRLLTMAYTLTAPKRLAARVRSESLPAARRTPRMAKTNPPKSDLPKTSEPAARAFELAGITRLAQLTKLTEADLLKLHGVGPKAIRILREALAERGLTFRPEQKPAKR